MGRSSGTWTPGQRAEAAAKSAEAARRRREAIIENVEWIVGTCPGEDVARRLGYQSADNLERVLQKWGRHDLAHRVRHTRTDYEGTVGVPV